MPQEIKFTVHGPNEGDEFTLELDDNETHQILRVGEIYVLKGNGLEDMERVERLRDVWNRRMPGKYLIFLLPGQELTRIELEETKGGSHC